MNVELDWFRSSLDLRPPGEEEYPPSVTLDQQFYLVNDSAVTDTPQGPGWWQASDGKYYPPQSPPQYAPPSSYAVSPGFPSGPGWVAPVTSGLAIASLVLAILWLGGLGSLLAVIFGIIAISQIRHSQGRKTGSGLAVAGLVVGGIGIVGSVLFYVVVVSVAKNVVNALSTTTLRLGQTGTYTASENDGVIAITVESVTYPIRSTSQFVQPSTNSEFAVAKVKGCAGPDGATTGAGLIGFQLYLPHGTKVDSTGDAISPGMDNVGSLAANQCVTGYVTFEIPKGSRPSSIEYFGAFIHPYRWLLG